MQTFILTRNGETPSSTWSTLLGPDGEHLCEILERGPAPMDHPRVPAGTYPLAIRPMGQSKFDKTLKAFPVVGYRGIIQVLNVPDRQNIEIHPANHYWELEGCLAPGHTMAGEKKLRAYRIPDGTSRNAFADIYPVIDHAVANGGAQITIKDMGQ